MADLFDELAGPAMSASEHARASLGRNLPKRFFKNVSVEKSEDGWRVLLDAKPVKTPAKSILAVPDEAIARAMAAEWEAQATHIDPGSMPLTKLVNTVIDGIARDPGAVADEIAAYAATDMLYYRADTPDRLVARQRAILDPFIAATEQRVGIRIKLAAGVMPIEQDPALVPAIRQALPEDPYRLAGLHVLTTLTGSVLVALAVHNRDQSPDAAWTAAHVDEDWNIELWGEDDEAKLRRAFRRREFDAAILLVLR